MIRKSLFLICSVFIFQSLAFAETVLEESHSEKIASHFDLPREVSHEKENVPDEKEESFKERKKFNQLSKPTDRISKVSMRDDVVYKLKTAVGYVSAIEFPETVLKAYVGDQDLFKVGVYDNEVLVKPLTDDLSARTNLGISTQSGRLSIDISVGSPETADFILDFRKRSEDVFVENVLKKEISKKEEEIKNEYQQKEDGLNQRAEELAKRKLTEEISKGSKTIELAKHTESGGIRINLTSLSQIGSKNYLRFGIRNLSDTPFKVSKVILGIQTYEKENLGFGKKPEGFTELTSELELASPVPPSGYVNGVLEFETRKLGANEKPVFLLLSEEGNKSFKIQGFRWLG